VPHFIEPLETRLAPATLLNPTTLTFLDVDGDSVIVKVSKPVFTAGAVDDVFQFSTGSVDGNNATPQQLQSIDLTQLTSPAAARGISLSVFVDPLASQPGDGEVNVGAIIGTGINFNRVTIDGDLGQIDAGRGGRVPAVVRLETSSLGAMGLDTQAFGGDLDSELRGVVSTAIIHGDIDAATLSASGIGLLRVEGSIIGTAGGDPSGDAPFQIRAAGSMGRVEVLGSVLSGHAAGSGSLHAGRDIGVISIVEDLQGGEGESSGRIQAFGRIGIVRIGGDLLGGTAPSSGLIFSGNTIDLVQIAGMVQGGTESQTGRINAQGEIGRVVIGESLVGGSGADSGEISSGVLLDGAIVARNGGIGSVEIGGNVQGGDGFSSGRINTFGQMGNVHIGGNLTGGSQDDTGLIFSGRGMGLIQIDGFIQGGDGAQSGRINSAGFLRGVRVGEYVAGGPGADSGEISSGVFGPGGVVFPGGIGFAIIEGDLTGGNQGPSSGRINTFGPLGYVQVNGSLVGGNAVESGLISAGRIGTAVIGGNIENVHATPSGDQFSGAILSRSSIGSVFIAGSVNAGSASAGLRPFERSVAVGAETNIGSLFIGNDVQGAATNLVLFTAGARGGQTGVVRFQVIGDMENAELIAGFSAQATGNHFTNPVATLRSVIIGGDLITSDIVAGVEPGFDGVFGSSDDQLVGGASPRLIANIARVVIGGSTAGTAGGQDIWAITSRRIAAVQIGGVAAPLTPGIDEIIIDQANDDFVIREVAPGPVNNT
jgi:hypothetical protein